MKDLNLKLIVIFLITFSQFSYASITVKNVRLWSAPNKTRLVFDISAPVKYRVFSLKTPNRVVIDLENTKLKGHFQKPSKKDEFIKIMRHAPRDKKNYRIVLDLKQSIKPISFLLKPNKKYGHRLVIDLIQRTTKKNRPTKVINYQKKRDIIIVIDAGHGGDDSGAKGPTGAREKKVVLQIAKKLKSLINKEKGLKAILTRKGDYYIGLRHRMELARKARADLFISIHADGFKKASARGSSVYIVSKRGANSEAARWLVQSENGSDLLGGVKLEGKNRVLKSVLVSLSQNATKAASLKAARNVYAAMSKINVMHSKKVQKAGFVVLKAPDIPSILVETAFISNPQEEKKLKSSKHQKRIAKALFSGIKRYFQANPPAQTLWALKQKFRYKIKSGDTLSAISVRYNVTLRAIKRLNNLKSSRIRVGQKIWIPAR